MREPASPGLADRARAAADGGEWQRAYDLLSEADVSTPLAEPDLALLAEVAYAAGHLAVTIDAWERVHAQSLRSGDRLAAAGAAVRVAMHLLFDTALMAPVRGWIGRAERLLEGHEEAPVHAWLAVVRNYERLLSGDFESARRWARRAVDVGTRCDPAAAAVGRVAEGRSFLLEGEVSRGVELLNEAAVATVSGELAPLYTGMVYCEVVCALQALAQYDLAEEWTDAMERWTRGQHVGSVHGRCRVHRAEILRLRGSLAEAEHEALMACEELRPYLRREFGWPLTELGRIRLRRGDVQGAEDAFRAALDVGWDPQPGLALVQLAQGDVASAVASIRDALENPRMVPSKELPPNTELRRAPLLEAQVEIEVTAGHLAVARAAADDLARIAALFQSRALAAAATLARGRVDLAARDVAGAQRAFEEAVQQWTEIGAPYEAALARVGLAHAHRAQANEERAILELRAARSAFERVGAVHQAADAGRAGGDAATHDATTRDAPTRDAPTRDAPTRDAPRRATGGQAGMAIDSHAAGESVFRHEGDYWCVAFLGRTTRLRDLKGLRYLARLLAEPGRELHALDIVARERGSPVDASHGGADGPTVAAEWDAGALLDARSKDAYLRRLTDIDEDIDEARAVADHERVAQASAERDFLVRELARAVGLGGRDRRAGSASERARASVTRAIRQAMTRIHDRHPELAEHLDRAIRTGTYCVYLPDPRIPTAWKL